MSNTPTTIPTVQATPTSSNSNSNHSTSTAASTPTPSTSSPATSASKFAVGAIPAFKKGPINYAAAASKSKPSPPVVNGKDATAVIGSVSNASTPSSAAASVAAIPARKQPTQPEVSVPRVNAVRSGAADCKFILRSFASQSLWYLAGVWYECTLDCVKRCLRASVRFDPIH